ncbi:Multidrug efflux pump subunit AcrA (membrane-fusion protein) [Butyrivibrio fibrisolvens DSM 3071]|uniref:Multidrug efflux pump subunit AcrA (Membrane-fusion protein) n=1 Tax=Butyrivibrio fibrisolvens DSM 3071 TaxID=1121131 RepID=A0A1M5T5S8_BUTFI|nr:HlyD family efflux transporter periplasmic adaptor subunit [Butyrivibrio fibrisolvens]SHH45713.1 Multidrug efflux pump subunit AcrA (membrane-fusion protein) [Butyrivibrio fibrisolvens DSM 3071]
MSKDREFDENNSFVDDNNLIDDTNNIEQEEEMKYSDSENETSNNEVLENTDTEENNKNSKHSKKQKDIDAKASYEYEDTEDIEDDDDTDDLEKAFEEETRRMNEKKLKRDARIPKGMTPQEYKAQKRKDAIKNIAIAFLAALLVLTLFSNTIMNYTLPQVATTYVGSNEISPQIRGTGTLTAGSTYDVVITQTRKIATVEVKVGQEVEKDQVLFTLEDAESEELEAAKKEAEDAKDAYDLEMFSADIPAADIQSIRSGASLSFDKFLQELAEANENYSAALQADTDVQAQIDEYEYYKKIASLYVTADEDRDKSTTGTTTMSDADIVYQQTLLEEQIKNLESEIADYETKITEFESMYGKDAQVYEDSSEDFINAYNSYREAIDNKYVAESKKGVAEREKAKLADFGNLETRNASYYDGLIASAEENKKQTAQALTEAEKTRSEVLAKIKAEIALVQKRTDYEQAQAKVEKLEETAIGATINAPVAGTITNLAYKAGESTKANETMATIQLEGQVLTMSFSVTTEQAKKVKVGQSATAQNAWAYSDLSAVLTSITNDSTDPNGHKVLNFEVSGSDLSAGQSLSLVMGENAVTYDLVVPNSAIREDNNGKFVLILESRSTPFGNRYIARRADITVVASDDSNSAITGNIEPYSYVITTATAPVASGDQVRLQDSN